MSNPEIGPRFTPIRAEPADKNADFTKLMEERRIALKTATEERLNLLVDRYFSENDKEKYGMEILRGVVEPGLWVHSVSDFLLQGGVLPLDLPTVTKIDFRSHNKITELPQGIRGNVVIASGLTNVKKIPSGLWCGLGDFKGCTGLVEIGAATYSIIADFDGCTQLTHIEEGFMAENAVFSECVALKKLPESLAHSAKTLDLKNCRSLEYFPENMLLQRLAMDGCSMLPKIPNGTHVDSLRGTLHGCDSLQSIGDDVYIGSDVDASSLSMLSKLGRRMVIVGNLNLSGCKNLKNLPPDIKIVGNLNIKDSGIKEIPAAIQVEGHITPSDIPIEKPKKDGIEVERTS